MIEHDDEESPTCPRYVSHGKGCRPAPMTGPSPRQIGSRIIGTNPLDWTDAPEATGRRPSHSSRHLENDADLRRLTCRTRSASGPHPIGRFSISASRIGGNRSAHWLGLLVDLAVVPARAHVRGQPWKHFPAVDTKTSGGRELALIASSERTCRIDSRPNDLFARRPRSSGVSDCEYAVPRSSPMSVARRKSAAARSQPRMIRLGPTSLEIHVTRSPRARKMSVCSECQ